MTRIPIRTYGFVFALMLTSYCNGQNSPPSRLIAKEGAEQTTLAKEDGYFVQTTDTASPYEPQSITRNMLQDKSSNYWLASWEGIV